MCFYFFFATCIDFAVYLNTKSFCLCEMGRRRQVTTTGGDQEAGGAVGPIANCSYICTTLIYFIYFKLYDILFFP
jgi:hypothetical protein